MKQATQSEASRFPPLKLSSVPREEVAQWLEEMKSEVKNLSESGLKSMLFGFSHFLQGKVRKKPYVMIRNGIALGAGLRGLSGDRFRVAALHLIRAFIHQTLIEKEKRS